MPNMHQFGDVLTLCCEVVGNGVQQRPFNRNIDYYFLGILIDDYTDKTLRLA